MSELFPGPLFALDMVVFASVAVIAWLWQRLLTRHWVRFRRRFERDTQWRLDRAFVFVEPARLLWVYCATVLGLTGLTFVLSSSLGFSIAVAVCAAAVPAGILGWYERCRSKRMAYQLPDFFSRLASLLRAGMGVNLAIEQLARSVPPPLGQELRQLQQERMLGVGFAEALEGLNERVPLRAMRLFGCLIQLSHAQGGGLAQAMAGLADGSRRELILQARCLALTAQARLQARVMCAIPLIVGALLYLLDPVLMTEALRHPTGMSCLILIVVLEAIGLYWVSRLVRS